MTVEPRQPDALFVDTDDLADSTLTDETVKESPLDIADDADGTTDEPADEAADAIEEGEAAVEDEPLAPIVAIVAHDDALIEDLIETVQAEGCRAIGSKLLGVHGEHVDVERFLNEVDPAVVIFDVVQPYADYLSMLRKLEALPESKNRRFIVTATDNVLLKKLGIKDAVPLREPEDIALVADAVESALSRGGD